MKKISAMIVDDNETDRYLLKRLLSKISHVDEIFEGDDGATAIEFLQRYDENKIKHPNGFPPTILFLDVNMPKMNGFEFLKHYQLLQEKHEDMSIVIMMFTSSANKEDIDRAFEFECVKDYLEKGNFKLEDLEEKISQYTL